jgi:hypothetical protein
MDDRHFGYIQKSLKKHRGNEGLSKNVQEVNNKQYASEGLSQGMAASDLFLAENRQKATVPDLSGENSIFPLNQFSRSSVFYKKKLLIYCHWLASQEGFSNKWQQDMRSSNCFLYSCFYLAPYRSRASKSGEPNTKPILFVWRFFFKISKNL